ncbi:hypothetical protein PR202_gb12317 [Eleusine coracana subsp. coracana]|uniref:Uncharacterized protein n=1 Tax=Eleusine coracana subsp. coracana TaxID=191504 RepID=A0AAV5EMH9_ELECO|nr:hypothetical protein PR202_gb12317 [Eleusine coracana subsp. coracana]
MDGGMIEKTQKEQFSPPLVAFVDGRGFQDASDDDACSICLEAFSDSDPSAVQYNSCCRGDGNLSFHLDGYPDTVLVRLLASRRAVSFAFDSADCSQELIEAIEKERNVQEKQAHTTTVFRHPLLGDFEVQHVYYHSYLLSIPVGADDAEVEEHILQHLAAASAIRRSHRHLRREGRRSRSVAHGHPQMLVLSATDETTSGYSVSSNYVRQQGDNEHPAAIISDLPIAPMAATEETTADTSVGDATAPDRPFGNNRNQSWPVNQGEAGPPDMQSFSETLKSRLQSVSTRYKDSITKNTREWKERWFTNSTVSNLGSEVKREVSAGIAAVSRMIERLETQDSTGPSSTPPKYIQCASDAHELSKRCTPQ